MILRNIRSTQELLSFWIFSRRGSKEFISSGWPVRFLAAPVRATIGQVTPGDAVLVTWLSN